MRPGDVDWGRIFGSDGVRWFHTGGVFCALSPDTAALAAEAMAAARRHGTIVSYDPNFRPSLWKASGLDAPSVNRALVPHVDVLLGNEEDFSAGLGYTLDGVDERLLVRDVATYETLLTTVMADHPQLALTAATLRDARTATLNDWSGVCRTRTSFHMGPRMGALEIFDRVGGGDSFVSGLVYGLLGGLDVDTALAYGVAHGALAMTTPGDTSMATLEEVERLVAGASPRDPLSSSRRFGTVRPDGPALPRSNRDDMADTLAGRPLEIIAGKNYAHLAIPRRDGTVQTVIVWAHTDDGNVTLNSAEGRSWPANLRWAGTPRSP